MAKKKNKREKELQKFVASLVVIIILAIIVLAVFYVSNGYKFDFGFLKKESESVSVNHSEVDSVRDLKVYFIDIGQGDCIFIELPDGRNMLIDAGKGTSANKRSYAVVDKYLGGESGNKVTIDYCVATHPDSDHIDILPYIYEQYDIKNSYRPYVYSENKSASALSYNKGVKIGNSTKIYYEYLTSVNNEQTYWEFFKDDSDFSNRFKDADGEYYEYTVNFVMPYAKEFNDYQYFTTPNDFSAVIMLEYADRKILFTGDIEYETGKKGAEQSFIREFSSNPEMVDCDVLKVAHHGSDSSTSPEFLSLVKPEYSVISCGLSNTHHHPLNSTLENLVKCGSDIYRTDLQGTIILTIDSKGEITLEKQTDKYDDKILDDGDTIKQYEETHDKEIEKFKATL